jgi:hypothetical protein
MTMKLDREYAELLARVQPKAITSGRLCQQNRICYHPQPASDLVRAIDRLKQHQRIQVIWLTNDSSIDGGLDPEQKDVVAAIRAAIDRFTES